MSATKTDALIVLRRGRIAADGPGALAAAAGVPLLSATVLRSNGFMDGLKTVIPDAAMVHDLDGGGWRKCQLRA